MKPEGMVLVLFGVSLLGFPHYAVVCSAATSTSCSQPVSAWTNDDVLLYLNSLGKAFQQYTQAFKTNAIDGSTLPSLTEDDFIGEDFNIQNKFHRRKLLSLVAAAQGEGPCIDIAAAREQRLNQVSNLDGLVVSGAAAFADPVSTRVIRKFEDNSIPIDDFARMIATEVDRTLHGYSQEFVGLLAVEGFTNFIIANSALVPNSQASLPGAAGTTAETCGSSGATAMTSTSSEEGLALVNHQSSVIQQAKADMFVILDAKTEAQSIHAKMRSAVKDLITAFEGFQKAAKRHSTGALSESEKRTQFDILREAFGTWRKRVEIMLGKASATSQAFLQRSKDRLLAMQAGGSAVHSNLKSLETADTELQKAHAKRKAVIDSSDKKVQLALAARSGALEGKVTSAKSRIAQLRKDVSHLTEIRQSKDKVIEEVSQFVMVQNQKKKEWRDWHIQRWWANMWGPEMETYYLQSDQNIAAQDLERSKAEKAKELIGEQINRYNGQISAEEQEVADMVEANATWNQTLESEGLFEAEEHVHAAMRQFTRIRGVLENAMKDAGVGDPRAAADVIASHHKAQILMHNSAEKASGVTRNLDSFQSKFDNMIRQIQEQESAGEGMTFLAEEFTVLRKLMGVTEELHSHRMLLLDDGYTKHDVVKAYLDRELSPTQGAKLLEAQSIA